MAKNSKHFKNSNTIKEADNFKIEVPEEIKKSEKSIISNNSFLNKIANDFSLRNWEHFICNDILVFSTENSNKQFTFYFCIDKTDRNLLINCQIIEYYDLYREGDYLNFETKNDVSLISKLDSFKNINEGVSIEEIIKFSSTVQENNGVVTSYNRKIKLDIVHWRYQISHTINSLLNSNDERQSIN